MTTPLKRGQLTTAAAMATFALAGNATLTLVSEKTGTRYTFKISRPKDASATCPWFVSVMYGPDNETQYAYLGCIFPDKRFASTRKSNIAADDIRVKAFAFFWVHVLSGLAPPSMECWHEGRCCRCGRKLTAPASIAAGIGPECAGRVQPTFFAEAA